MNADEGANPGPSPEEMRLKTTQGLILTGSLPVFDCPQILEHFSTWVFSVPTWQSLWQLPADIGSVFAEEIVGRVNGVNEGDRPNRPITLLPADPLGRECFALILLPHVSLALVCEHADDGTPINFQFSFSPAVIEEAWQSLRARIAITSGHHLKQLDNLVAQFPPVEPRYDTVMEFGQLMWRAVPASGTSGTVPESDYIGAPFDRAEKNAHSAQATPVNAAYDPSKSTPSGGSPSDSGIFGSDDVAFLRAFAHGIRTPLTTIRTYTRLLQRKDLAADVQRHLGKIDRECSEQIDRFDLIFKAVENETCDGNSPPTLHPFCLKKMITEGEDRWQHQAERHNLTFAVSAPPLIPPIAGDCDLLDQMLTELIETLIRSLPAGSHIALDVIPAGDRLKLELVCEDSRHQHGWLGWGHTSFQAIGRLLAFQPETGSVSLNLDVTKNLFQSIGGKLTVRHSPQRGDVVTIFLPVDNTPATIKTSKNSWFV